jgi:hypothetical protein
VNAFLAGASAAGGGFGGTGTTQGIAGAISVRPNLIVVDGGQQLDLGIRTGQTGAGDAAREVVPAALTVEAGGAATVINSELFGRSAAVGVRAGGTLMLPAGVTQTLDRVDGDGGVIDLAPTAKLTLGTGDVSSVLAASVTGTGTLVKTGTGRLALGASPGSAVLLQIDAGSVAQQAPFASVGKLINGSGGALRVGGGQGFWVGTSGGSANAGSIELTGNAGAVGGASEIEFVGKLVNAASTGLISARGPVVMRFTGGLTNDGAMGIAFADASVSGDVVNSTTGSIVVSGGSRALFDGDVVNDGAFSVGSGSTVVFFGAFSGKKGTTGTGSVEMYGDLRPGHSPAAIAFGGNVTLGRGATLNIELGGSAPGSGYDKVSVAGALAVEGALNVSLIDGFSPRAGDAFDVLDFASLGGTFGSVSLPGGLAPGLRWVSDALHTSGTLYATYPGDANVDGRVTGADLALMTPAGDTWFKGDFNGDGSVNADDYALLYYGAAMQEQSGGPMTPEPSVGVVAPVVLVMLRAGRRRRRG